MAEAEKKISLKIILRDQNPEIMNRFLTNGARAIPIVIFLDDNLLKPDLTILFIDPWWFNEKVSENGGMHQLDYPNGVSIDHLFTTL